MGEKLSIYLGIEMISHIDHLSVFLISPRNRFTNLLMLRITVNDIVGENLPRMCTIGMNFLQLLASFHTGLGYCM